MKKVLIVDDDQDIIYVVERILKKNGFEVISTLRGEETIPMVKSFVPNVILLDVFLSGIDGIELCKRLKGNPETKDIPVVLFSAHTNKEEVMKFCKADDFLQKPFEVCQLVDKISSNIGRNKGIH